VKKHHTILIADRNRNVRELLRREICAEGYDVRTASSAAQVLEAVTGEMPPDIVVLDLDLPDAGGVGIVDELKTRAPSVSVIVHTLVSECLDLPPLSGMVDFVEKQGNSVEKLKKMIYSNLSGNIPKVSTVDTDGCTNYPDH
jgi:DNA-binding NtrC family response regulator